MWELSRERIGSLDCCLVTPTKDRGAPEAIAIFCHGFGAPGEDLVPVAEELLDDRQVAESKLAFVFPAAPLPLDPTGQSRAWWPIDLARLQAVSVAGDIRGLSDLVPGRLATCRGLIEDLISQLQSRWSISQTRTIVGGFSQGAMLATDVALHAASPLGGLIAWSGALINQSEWKQLAARQPRFSIVQSHGLWDPILPFATAEALRDMLVEAGLEVNFVSFQGYHAIPPAALGAARQLLQLVIQ
jgi:phospholipase/carboxylesterase